MKSVLQLRADAIADQTIGPVQAALEEVVRAIIARDSGKAIMKALTEYGVASFAAGWDQCEADLRAILVENGIEI